MADYTGIFVNDYETATYHFGNDNVECNVQLIRYLTKNTHECGTKPVDSEWGNIFSRGGRVTF